ncbi:hypothetical protein Tco_1147741 [Tanacetum coccineum]
MKVSSIPMKLALIISFSLTASSYSEPPSLRKFISKKPQVKATARDILSLLGTQKQASSVHPQIATQLQSCFNFLVPFTPTTTHSNLLINRKIQSVVVNDYENDDVNVKVWAPPESVLEIARLAFDSGGDPGSIQRTLDPTMLYVSLLSLFTLRSRVTSLKKKK